MTVNEANMYFRNYNLLCELFGEIIVNDVIKDVNVSDFQVKERVRGNGCSYYESQGYPIVARGTYTFKEWRGEWSREVQDSGVEYLIPDPYQFNEPGIIRDCLSKIAPYLNTFTYNVYRFMNERPELYIKCPSQKTVDRITGTALYVPIKALIELDKQQIIDRMNTYFTEYYRGADRKPYLDESLSLLDSPEAKKLFEILDTNKRHVEKDNL